MAEDLNTQLTRVQAAIAAIEGGNQSSTILGRTFTKADLATLYEREKFLLAEINRQARGGLKIQRAVPL